nr:immunoglobulin heavy chain junction region [Macaca mulatta]MOX60330.1 immunoglobulin heavy chain junction region [Macaca mulatta]MOX62182.1 immunoglobulin heavy chain junction region [Macaca mulatta]MOX62645.1 immunoglobulin heavy chain junction region [Macaca mulatta]MOX65604.1 immunoglobulin heavy chain junction region [Macaca mulatta]
CARSPSGSWLYWYFDFW